MKIFNLSGSGGGGGSGTVTTITAATGITLTPNPITTIGTVGLTIPVVISSGGTNSITDLSGSTIMISNGSAIVQGTAGTTTTVLHGNAAGAPTYGAVVLTTDVSGILPVANGGSGTTTAFTAGSVVFAGASGVYSQDNANFFWDATNHRLGIGTTAPVSKLSVLVAPTASANFGTVSIGSGGFAGNFAGSSSGTSVAVNEANGYGGDLFNFQVNGTQILKLTSGGTLLGSSGGLILGTGGSSLMAMDTGGSVRVRNDWVWGWSGSTNPIVSADTGMSRLGAGSIAFGDGSANNTTANISFNKIAKYQGVTTTGWGVPALYGNDRKTAQTTAQSLATFTNTAADGSFLVSANILVTTSSAENFTVTVSYTDEGNTARTLTLNFQTIAGVIGTAINFANGAVPYEGIPTHIRCKASTTIIIASTGTFTGATYNFEEMISRIS